MTIQTLPLFNLTLSTLNVRRTERDADIAALAEDIAACGLKQNLVVVPAHSSTAETEDNYGDKFEVVAGGRRYQALRLLAEDGRIEHDHPVPVLIEQREAARQTSLSENLHRVAMNPADEFEAFAAIVAQAGEKGEPDPASYCAKRLGVTKAHVEGRLRLAALCPEVLNALRDGRIGIESAKAYAITSDHEHQLKAFTAQEKSKFRPHDASTVRDAMRGRTMPLDCKLARYVGQIAYRAAGGRTEAEMFMGAEGQERIIDTALLENLAKEKGADDAKAQAKKDGFKDGLLAFGGYDYNPNWPKPPAGFEKTSRWAPELEDTKKPQRKPCIAVYRIDGEGAGLDYIGHFGPAAPKDDGNQKEAAAPRDYAAERMAAAREEKIEITAARMAIGLLNDGHLQGTPLQGRAFWPTGWINEIEEDRSDESSAFVAVQIRVPLADIESHKSEAARLVDEAEVAAQARKEADAAAETALGME